MPAAVAGGGAAPRLLVANKGDRTLGIIDRVVGRQVAVVADNGVTGHEGLERSLPISPLNAPPGGTLRRRPDRYAVGSHAIRGRDDEAARSWDEFQRRNLPENPVESVQ